jgi:pimeloyl-ACP methyl ester carboxylesterase
MKYMIRDKTAYAYKEIGSGPPPFVFVHGWACDHTFFSPQIDYFRRYHRVIAPDLLGHGAAAHVSEKKGATMKIGFVSMPLSGHLNPMTALGAAMARCNSNQERRS